MTTTFPATVNGTYGTPPFTGSPTVTNTQGTSGNNFTPTLPFPGQTNFAQPNFVQPNFVQPTFNQPGTFPGQYPVTPYTNFTPAGPIGQFPGIWQGQPVFQGSIPGAIGSPFPFPIQNGSAFPFQNSPGFFNPFFGPYQTPFVNTFPGQFTGQFSGQFPGQFQNQTCSPLGINFPSICNGTPGFFPGATSGPIATSPFQAFPWNLAPTNLWPTSPWNTLPTSFPIGFPTGVQTGMLNNFVPTFPIGVTPGFQNLQNIIPTFNPFAVAGVNTTPWANTVPSFAGLPQTGFQQGNFPQNIFPQNIFPQNIFPQTFAQWPIQPFAGQTNFGTRSITNMFNTQAVQPWINQLFGLPTFSGTSIVPPGNLSPNFIPSGLTQPGFTAQNAVQLGLTNWPFIQAGICPTSGLPWWTPTAAMATPFPFTSPINTSAFNTVPFSGTPVFNGAVSSGPIANWPGMTGLTPTLAAWNNTPWINSPTNTAQGLVNIWPGFQPTNIGVGPTWPIAGWPLPIPGLQTGFQTGFPGPILGTDRTQSVCCGGVRDAA